MAATPISQTPRSLEVKPSAADTGLVLLSISGSEEISVPFRYRLEMLSEVHDVKAKDLVGKGIGFRVQQSREENRWFHGVVARFSAGGLGPRSTRRYTAEVVPWLWLLSRRADCRIFQEKTAKEIIEQVFSDAGFSDFEFQVTRTLKTREYCVQYRETDLDFVSRLMEEEGIFYFFKHEEEKHQLVMADSADAFEACSQGDVRYTIQSIQEPHVFSWEHNYEFRVGKTSQRDYNFKTPSVDLETFEIAGPDTLLEEPDKFEVFDYPGLYVDKAEGKELAVTRIQEEEAAEEVVEGASGCASFSPGGKFKITEHDVDQDTEKKEWAIVGIRHEATDETGYAEGARTSYGNQFTCIPGGKPYRPPQRTEKPTVDGIQTAVVTGPSGEEIFTDEYGRVKVQFHWDRKGEKDDKTSCWIRVAQNWAGEMWGFQFIPRIGHEVVVCFLEGDPDQPLITGSVYNAELMPPLVVPDKKTQSGIMTHSSPGGGAENFNQLRFEDKKDSEQIYFHAEKNFDRVVENDDTETIGNNQTNKIKVDRTEEVDGNEKITIKGNRDEEVGGNETILIKGDRKRTVNGTENVQVDGTRDRKTTGNESIVLEADLKTAVSGKSTHTVGGEKSTTVDGKESLKVGGDREHTVKGKETMDVSGDRKTTVGGKETLTVSSDGTLKFGGKGTVESTGNMKIKSDGKITIEAASGIEIKCGGSKIELKSFKIDVKSIMVKVEGSAKADVKGAMASLDGSGMAKVKGGMVKIN